MHVFLQMTTYYPAFLKKKIDVIPLTKPKLLCSFSRKFWTSSPTLTDLNRKGKTWKLRNSRYLDGRMIFKHCTCCEQKCCKSSHLIMAGMKYPFLLYCKTFQLKPTSFSHTDVALSVPKHKSPCKSGIPNSSAHKTCLLYHQTVNILPLLSIRSLTQTNSISYCFYKRNQRQVKLLHRMRRLHRLEQKAGSYISAPPLFSCARQLLIFIAL